MNQSPNRLRELVPQRIRSVLRRVEQKIWTRVADVHVAGSPLSDTRLEPAQARGLEYTPLVHGERFGHPGGDWQYRWMKLDIPERSLGARRHLFWICQGEATVYAGDEAWAGLDVTHHHCRLPESTSSLYIEVATYQTGIWTENSGLHPDYGCRFDDAYVAERNARAWSVYWDLRMLFDLLMNRLEREGYDVSMQEGYNPQFRSLTAFTRDLIDTLDGVCDAYDSEGLASAGDELAAAYSRYRAHGAPLDGVVNLVGQAHLDLVWLWPERETYRKAEHTAATVLRLMEDYPELTFQQSSPFLMRKMETAYPQLMERITERVNEGRWELSGGMDLESDVLLTSGEGLVRSLMYGQTYFSERFGAPSRLLWLPDVFGFSNCLPQLMKQADIDFLFTTKLHWSSITPFPFTPFRWRGADGTEVLGYSSQTKYNGQAELEQVLEANEVNHEAHRHPGTLLPTGYGDGGGGPTEENCERARRMQSLHGVPAVQWETPVSFFQALEARWNELPVYSGELYLEYHRGTYTSQSRFKRLVRSVESKTMLVEAIRAYQQRQALSYNDWERLLLSQFHDAIPGSSIYRVYAELEAELRDREELMDAAATAFLRDSTGRDQSDVAVFNPLPVARRFTLAVEEESEVATTLRNLDVLYQSAELPESERMLLFQVDVPGFGLYNSSEYGVGFAGETAGRGSDERRQTRADTAREHDASGSVTGTPSVSISPDENGCRLANERLEVEIDNTGCLRRIREYGTAMRVHSGSLRIHTDHPANFDAWDVDQAAIDLSSAVALGAPEIVESGPIRCTAASRGTREDGSEIELRYSLASGASWVTVEVWADWQAEHRLLKYELVTDYRSSHARFGMPFGSVRRRIEPGSRQADAMWEVPGQRWAALTNDHESEGVGIATEATYGFSARPGQISVSLLRASTSPDPHNDRGEHRVRFALAPYAAYSVDDTPSTALLPEIAFGSYALTPRHVSASEGFTFARLGTLVPSAIKPAEDGTGVVVRAHETHGVAGSAVLALENHSPSANAAREGAAPGKAEKNDILERHVEELTLEEGELVVPYEPYEVVTIRLPYG